MQNNQECVLVNEANCDDSILYISVNESVLHSESPRKSQRNKLPFSRESHASVRESLIVENEEPCSSSNASLKPEEVLYLLQDNAPPCFKYCLTMVPRETDSMEKVLKSRMQREGKWCTCTKKAQDFQLWCFSYQ